MSKPVYIIDGRRTPFLKAMDRPGHFRASDLAVNAARGLLTGLPFEANQLDEVILGCVMPRPDEANIARVVSLRLGCGHNVPAWTVQRNCASGMQALDSAMTSIKSGRSDLVLAGGTEAMSHAQVSLSTTMVEWLSDWHRSKGVFAHIKTLLSLRPTDLTPVISLLKGLTDPIVGLSMGQTAEILAKRFGITREEMDAFSIESHERLAHATDNGYFDGEVETLFDINGDIYNEDNGLRRDSKMEKLATLRPVFDRQYGIVTAGNSAQVTDGAAMVVLASIEAVKKHNLKPIGKITDCHWAGLDPSEMGLGPVYATAKLLQAQNLKISDINYWEINEAFSAQVLSCLKAFEDEEFCQKELGLEKALGKIDRAILNIDGGGVSMGHPVGASGARIILHLLNVLKRNHSSKGIATLCIGGGQGGAVLIETVGESLEVNND